MCVMLFFDFIFDLIPNILFGLFLFHSHNKKYRTIFYYSYLFFYYSNMMI
jgi:hypothetical protein